MLGKGSTSDEANAVSLSKSFSLLMLLLLLLLLLSGIRSGTGGKWTLSKPGGRRPRYADATRLARQDAGESCPESLAEECVDDRVGRGRHIAPPDNGRRDVRVAEPLCEACWTEHRDDVDEEERSPEQRESQKNNS